MAYLLRVLHGLGMALIAGGLAMGYGARWGLISLPAHIAYGFFAAMPIALAHALTLFYFAGIGVSLREALSSGPPNASGLCASGEVRRILEASSTLRKRLALPLGLALVSLMATVILGGGSHTRTLPTWPHHALALAAVTLNLVASARCLSSLRAQEAMVTEARSLIEGSLGRAGEVDRVAAARLE